jgi:hypothetical protein
MAKRSIPLVGRVFRFAIRKGIIENDPTPHLHEALKPRKVRNMARLDISEFPLSCFAWINTTAIF